MTSSYVSTFYKHQGPEKLPPPPVRRLRGYAFDPSLSLRLDTALVNHTIFDIDWEPLMPGPGASTSRSLTTILQAADGMSRSTSTQSRSSPKMGSLLPKARQNFINRWSMPWR